MSYKNGQMHQNLAKKVVKNAVKNGQKLVFLDSFWTRVQLTSPNPKLDSRVRVSSLDALLLVLQIENFYDLRKQVSMYDTLYKSFIVFLPFMHTHTHIRNLINFLSFTFSVKAISREKESK